MSRRSSTAWSYVVLVTMLLASCFVISEDPYSYGDLRRTVQERSGGTYIVYFPVPQVEQLDPNPYVAVAKYLSTRQLVPSACGSGIVVLSHSVMQGGYHGAATFRCAA
jgi:hypothetical protein